MCSLPTRPSREEKGALSNLIKTLLLSHNSSAYSPLFQASAKGVEKCQAFRMRAKKEQKKLNRRPHPSYPSARNDLLGLLSASQSFHTTLCPAIYLQEKQNCKGPSGSRGRKKSTREGRFQQHSGNCAIHHPSSKRTTELRKLALSRALCL